MADKDTTTPTPTADDSSPKGVGIVGGAAAVVVGAGAGLTTASKLQAMAVEIHNGKVTEYTSKLDTAMSAYKKANSEPEIGTPAHEQWSQKLLESGKELKTEFKKLETRGTNLEEASKSKFFQKGMKVAFNGGAKVQAIVASAAVAATLATAFVVKKLRGGSSHADTVDQQRAAAPSGPAMG